MQINDFGNSTVNREPLYAQVTDQILQYIIDNGLPVSARLPSERKLSEQFGVSRVVIREAMKVLVQNGVVSIQSGRGTFVVDRTRASLQQSLDLLYRVRNLDYKKIWEVRTTLEIMIASLAALRANADDIALLELYIDEMEQSIPDVERHVSADEQFHSALAATTGNELFEALVQSLIFFLKNARRMTAREPNAENNALASHKRILEAVRCQDAKRAELEMRSHLEQVERVLDVVLSAQQANTR